jgi:hypothetical protein
MIDATHCKVHPHAVGAVGGTQAMSRTKAIDLINGFAASHLLADRAYGTQ